MTRALVDLGWPRHTERLTLRPAAVDDAAAFYSYLRLPQVAHWLASWPTDWDQYLTRFRFRMHHWVAVELSGQLIGGAKIAVEDAWAQEEAAELARATQAELGWTFHPDFFGQGYAIEVARELLAICFDGIGLRRVYAGCFAENVASWKVMEKLGMRREAYHVRESLHRDGTWRDGLIYAILADEWVKLP